MPITDKQLRRTYTLSVRVTKAELDELKRRASADGRTCAGYARYMLLNSTPKS